MYIAYIFKLEFKNFSLIYYQNLVLLLILHFENRYIRVNRNATMVLIDQK